MSWFVAAAILLAIATILDLTIRIRMYRIGYKWVFLLGGAFDYNEYHRARGRYGWSAWPVRVFWICALFGILSIGVGLVGRYGLHPTPRRTNPPTSK